MAVHIIWSSAGVRLPQEDAGPYPGLNGLYERLAQAGGRMFLSHPLCRVIRVQTSLPALSTLDPEEVRRVGRDLEELTGPKGDRIAGNLPVLALAVRATGVHLLVDDSSAVAPQVIGRLKSKTSSWLLRTEARRGQRHVWSAGYWSAQVLDEISVGEVRGFILSQHCEE